jgi:uncharacterized 2Fe-2S/4Fe-4S cluster protein (DUF4445 family)
MKTYTLTIHSTGKNQPIQEGTLLIDALMDMGIMLKTPCGGEGRCGKCIVETSGKLSEVTEQEKRHSITGGTRLACQARIEGDVTVFVDERSIVKKEIYPAIDLESRYGIAVDIGTTTVQMKLVDLIRRESFLIQSFLNPQRRFGYDVIARITSSGDPDIFSQLVHLIRNAIMTTLRSFMEGVKLSPDRIERFVFSGNTTMMHLLFNLDVSTIGVYPFRAFQLDFDNFGPEDIDGEMFPHARVYALPAASSYLGADLIGGLTLCWEGDYRRNVIFIDMGTNGELFVISSSGEIFATSCAMGPALEGMNISSGMTADDGAITHVMIESNRLRYEMLGDNSPVGMSGTALIDLIANLLERGIITQQGAFAKEIPDGLLPEPARHIEGEDVRRIALWNNISLSQKDIRNVQLAKGASLSASRILLSEAGCGIDDIEHVLIAGAFGQHLNIENFKRLHFLPDFPNANYCFLGNSSLKSAENACVDHEFLVKARNLRDRVRVVELSMHPDFNREFVDAIKF